MPRPVSERHSRQPVSVGWHRVECGPRVGEQPLHAYGFRAVKPGQKIDYKPGDVLYAQLPVNERRVLRWDRGRSRRLLLTIGQVNYGNIWSE